MKILRPYSSREIVRAHLLAAQAGVWESTFNSAACIALDVSIRAGLADGVMLSMRWQELGSGFHIWTRESSVMAPRLPGEDHEDPIVHSFQIPLPRQVRAELADLAQAQGRPEHGPVFQGLTVEKLGAARARLLADAGLDEIDYRYMLQHIGTMEIGEDPFVVGSYLGRSEEGKIALLSARRAFIERVGEWFDALLNSAPLKVHGSSGGVVEEGRLNQWGRGV